MVGELDLEAIRSETSRSQTKSLQGEQKQQQSKPEEASTSALPTSAPAAVVSQQFGKFSQESLEAAGRSDVSAEFGVAPPKIIGAGPLTSSKEAASQIQAPAPQGLQQGETDQAERSQVFTRREAVQIEVPEQGEAREPVRQQRAAPRQERTPAPQLQVKLEKLVDQVSDIDPAELAEVASRLGGTPVSAEDVASTVKELQELSRQSEEPRRSRVAAPEKSGVEAPEIRQTVKQPGKESPKIEQAVNQLSSERAQNFSVDLGVLAAAANEIGGSTPEPAADPAARATPFAAPVRQVQAAATRVDAQVAPQAPEDLSRRAELRAEETQALVEGRQGNQQREILRSDEQNAQETRVSNAKKSAVSGQAAKTSKVDFFV